MSRSVGVGVWRLGERFGFDLVGATEAPRTASDAAREKTFEEIASARAGDGTLHPAGCPYPVHELVRPADFPLLDTVVGLSAAVDFRSVFRCLRAAKRVCAATP